MKNCEPYGVDGVLLENCNKINFVYGANGSGKSTISNFLSHVDKIEMPGRFLDSAIEWERQNHETIIVYNKEFRESNFKQDIPGVFTLGQATIEQVEKLNESKKERDSLQNNYNTKMESITNKNNEIMEKENRFQEDSWNQILKKYERPFKNAFDGYRNSKTRFVS